MPTACAACLQSSGPPRAALPTRPHEGGCENRPLGPNSGLRPGVCSLCPTAIVSSWMEGHSWSARPTGRDSCQASINFYSVLQNTTQVSGCSKFHGLWIQGPEARNLVSHTLGLTPTEPGALTMSGQRQQFCGSELTVSLARHPCQLHPDVVLGGPMSTLLYW